MILLEVNHTDDVFHLDGYGLELGYSDLRNQNTKIGVFDGRLDLVNGETDIRLLEEIFFEMT